MKILIDNGHGENTPGKRSPDGRFREYKYNREIARAVVEHLTTRGHDAQLLVPEEEDIPLKERLRRANKLSCQIGSPVQETLLVSIHVNAAGSGLMWHNATGWCAYTYYATPSPMSWPIASTNRHVSTFPATTSAPTTLMVILTSSLLSTF